MRSRSSADPWRRIIVTALVACLGLAGRATSQSAIPLALGRPIEDRLAGSATRTYTVELAAGQIVRVRLTQCGLDILARIKIPGVPEAVELDGVQSSRGAEMILATTNTEGTLSIEVHAFDSGAAEGGYEILLEPLVEDPSAKETTAAHAWLREVQAEALIARGDAAARQKGIEGLTAAVALWHEAGDGRGEAEALYLLGLACDQGGEKKEAIDHLSGALALQRVLADMAPAANTLADRGAVYDDIGHPEEALADLDTALAQFRRLADSRGEARTLSNLASAHDKQGDRPRAQKEYSAALELCRSLGDRTCQAANLNNMGRLHSLLGEPLDALARYREALDLWQAAGEKGNAAMTVMNMGAVAESIAQPREALEHYEMALRLGRETGDRRVMAFVFHNRAAVDAELGETQAALDDYEQALVLWREMGDRRDEAATLGNLARLVADLGETEKSLALFSQSLPLHQASQDKAVEAGTRYQLGRLLIDLGRWQEADGELVAAQSLWEALGSRRKLGLALAARGAAALAAGRAAAALDLQQEALPILRAAQNRRGEAEALRDLGITLASLGRNTEALEHLGAALAIQRDLGDRAAQAETLYARARIERSQGDLDAAWSSIHAAFPLVNQLRARVLSSNLRAKYLLAKRRYVRFSIDLLMELARRRPQAGYDALAFQANEEFLARNLLDSLAVRGADLRAGAEDTLVERERDLLTRIAALDVRQTRLRERDDDREATKGSAELDHLLAELDRVQAEILQAIPHHADLTQPRLLTVAQVQSQILDPRTLVLEYSLGPEKSYLWALSTSAVTSAELPPRSDIERSVKELLDILRSGPQPLAKGRLAQVAAALRGTLLGKVGDLTPFSRLVIVPDGALQRLPWAMLAVRERENEPLVKHHEIIILPSVSVIPELRRPLPARRRSRGTLAVLADPVFSPDDPRLARRPASAGLPAAVVRSTEDFGAAGLPRLPGTLAEARSLRALLPADQVFLAVSFDASKPLVLNGSLGGYRILHFATHALLNERHPELSGMVLSLIDREGKEQDGFLRLGEIYNLELPADLVVLSGCRTALGKELEGEGLLGLTRGFLHAGASAVVASLWEVDDRATSELMKRFYRKMLKDGLPPSAALHSAQASLSDEGRHPADWAGFVIQGDWQ
jgi:CHAT domain-containing protein